MTLTSPQTNTLYSDWVCRVAGAGANPHNRRTHRYHLLALMIPTVESSSRAQLAERYKCELITDVSFETCRAVEDRLVSSLSAEQLAELETRPLDNDDQAERDFEADWRAPQGYDPLAVENSLKAYWQAQQLLGRTG